MSIAVATLAAIRESNGSRSRVCRQSDSLKRQQRRISIETDCPLEHIGQIEC